MTKIAFLILLLTLLCSAERIIQKAQPQPLTEDLNIRILQTVTVPPPPPGSRVITGGCTPAYPHDPLCCDPNDPLC